MEMKDKRSSTISRVRSYFRQARDTLETLEENIIALFLEDQEGEEGNGGNTSTSSCSLEGLEESGDTKSADSNGLKTSQVFRPKLRKPKINRNEEIEAPLELVEESVMPPVPLREGFIQFLTFLMGSEFLTPICNQVNFPFP